MSNLDEKWEAIAQEAIDEAELVKCSGPAFVRGLKEIEAHIRHRRQGAEEEFDTDDDGLSDDLEDHDMEDDDE